MALHTKWSSGDLIFYDGTQDIFTIKNSTGGLVVGESGLGIDFTFYGATTGKTIVWDESEDELDITATVEMQTTNKIQFGTTGSYIHASTGSQLDIVTTGTLYLNGEVTYPDPYTSGSSGVTLTATSNRIQFLDPGTTGGGTTGGNMIHLPAEAGSAGIIFYLVNTSTASGEDFLVVDDSTGAICVLANKEAAFVICDGTSWNGGVVTRST